MSTALPYLQSQNRQFNQFQQTLNNSLNTLTSNPLSNATILKNVSLTTGSINQVPTMINRALQGWFPIRVRAQCELWDSQDSNPQPTQTLALNTSANVVVDLMVF